MSEIEQVHISKIKPDRANANKGSERGRAQIEASLRQYGFADAGTLDRNNTIIGGNKRTEVAAEIGMDDAIILDVDGTKPVFIRRNDLDLNDPDDDRARLLAYALNRSQEVSLTWDADQLLADLSAGLPLDQLWRKDELDELLADLQPPATTGNTEPQVDKAEELRQRWGVESGQLWQLGEHRLICGDCTDKATVERVMGGERAQHGFTSPPYNAGNSKTGAYHGGSAKRSDFKRMYSHDMDDMSSEQYVAFLLSVLNWCSLALDDTAAMGWNVAYNAKSRREYGQVVFSASNPLPVQETIIWDKSIGMNIAANNIYSRAAELVFLLSRSEKYRSNQSGGVYWNVWRISTNDGDNMQNGHGASFPLGLPSKSIEQHSVIGDLVYEPFSGSGTTLIACENLSRRCRACEISPAYVGVALERFYQHTGIQPVLLDRA